MEEELWQDIAKCLSPKGYLWAGYPKYRRLFGRDSLIAAWQLLKTRPAISRVTLMALAKYQGWTVDPKREEEPGKILHEHYDGGLLQQIRDLSWSRLRQYLTWGFPYYGSIDSTAWWLILLSRFFQRTGDRTFICWLWTNVFSALQWIERYGDVDADCFIEYRRKNRHALLHQGWKDGLQMSISQPVAMVEVQGYYYLAYLEIAALAGEVMQDRHAKAWLEEKAASLKEKFNAAFWVEEREFFALALDGQKEQVATITSNPGHLLFTGIVDYEKEVKIVRRLFADDMWTPYGIRTHSASDHCFDAASYHQGSIWPHDNWIIYVGLKERGYHQEAETVKQALIRAYKTLGCMPELYGVENNRLFYISTACCPQAWASGALLNLLTEK
ncbi:MAG: hypothetical protein HYT21_00615 [Candidatus Nealsonbacteria bacterium]|nr:hypothetical protein [Candidatus Nealsonbacteria bacterium]